MLKIVYYYRIKRIYTIYIRSLAVVDHEIRQCHSLRPLVNATLQLKFISHKIFPPYLISYMEFTPCKFLEVVRVSGLILFHFQVILKRSKWLFPRTLGSRTCSHLLQSYPETRL